MRGFVDGSAVADELEIDLDAVRALATAHDRSAAVLEACARMVEHRVTSSAGGYAPIARALAEWAGATGAIAAELAALTDRTDTTDREINAGLQDLL
jgi:hypothetical protein